MLGRGHAQVRGMQRGLLCDPGLSLPGSSAVWGTTVRLEQMGFVIQESDKYLYEGDVSVLNL